MYFMVEESERVVARSLNPQQTAKPAAAVVGFGAVVIDEDAAETAVAEDRAAEFADFRWSFQPRRRFGVELTELLQRVVLFLGEHLDTHRFGQVHRAVFRFELLARVQ